MSFPKRTNYDEVVWVMRIVHGARLLDLESLLHLSFKL